MAQAVLYLEISTATETLTSLPSMSVVDCAVGQHYILQNQDCTVDVFSRNNDQAIIRISAGRNGEFSQIFVSKRQNLSAVERLFFNWAFASAPKLISPDTYEIQEI